MQDTQTTGYVGDKDGFRAANNVYQGLCIFSATPTRQQQFWHYGQ